MSGLSISTINRLISANQLAIWQPGGKRHRLLISVSALGAQTDESQIQDHEASQKDDAPQKLSGPKPTWKNFLSPPRKQFNE